MHGSPGKRAGSTAGRIPGARRLALLLALILGLGGGAPGALRAQDAVPDLPEIAGPTLDRVDRAQLEALAAEARDDASTDALATQLDALFAEALGFLDASQLSRERALEFEQRRLEAPALLDQLQAELATEPAPVALPDELPDDLGELHAALAQAGADLAAARSRVSELQLRADTRAQRRADLPGELTEARSRVDALLEALDSPLPEGTPPELIQARRLRRAAELQAAESRLLALQQEREAQTLGDSLLDLERQRAARRRARAEGFETLWREQVNAAERAEAEAALRAAREAAEAAAHPAVAAVAEETRALAERRTGPDGLRMLIERAARELDDMRRRLAELESDKRSVEAKKEAAGLSQQIGRLLVRHRGDLPSPEDHRARIARRSITDASFAIQRIDLADAQREHFDVDAVVSARLEDLEPADRARVEAALREALSRQAQVRAQLLGDLRAYTDLLEQLNAVERELADEAEAFKAFIDEHVLWVRIADPIYADSLELVRRSRVAAREFLDPTTWLSVLDRGGELLGERVLTIVLEVALLALLFGARNGLRRRIGDDAYLVSRLRTDQFVYTIRTLVATALLALPGPLLVFLAAGWLDAVANMPASDAATRFLARASAKGAEDVAVVWYVTNLIWVACRPKGLAEAHFRWAASRLRLLRRHLRWFVALLLPLIFLFAVMSGEDTSADASVSLGRLALIAQQLTIMAFAWCVLRRDGGVFANTIEKHPHGWVARLNQLVTPVALGVPAVLLTMSALGYLYTANQLQARLGSSLYLILALIAAHALLMRWLFVARRRLALAQYRKRRQAAQEKAEGSLSEEFVEDEVDIPSLSEQSETLVETLVGVALVIGLGLVWADVLPALGFLDGFELWEHTVETERSMPQTDGTSTLEVVKELVPVTLADLLAALVALTLTVIAARNLPGLLEIMVLQRLPMQRAGRYAVTTLSRYLIVVIGLAIMFKAVGIGWSTVQWLAAAVSVGLGFGLQEIFANFVSGLIILFERPIRVGDTVTVGTTTGTVNKVHMRATTIITWDRTELIVPNREFITNQLVNWTLSDSVLRVIVKVGIAYGSDTRKAEELLYRVAEEHPDILDDPPPRVVFTEFGDSTLVFELRVFVSEPELFRTIHHPLNNAIDRLFKEHGVEIAFPQRDLHLRASDTPLTVIHRRDIVRREARDADDEAPRARSRARDADADGDADAADDPQPPKASS